ncbi:hypothetical protein TNCV_2738521 [Trichonephila clavipes]|nr:hypothetical protein TNCV_2738521 [Trichonephila clavipes]
MGHEDQDLLHPSIRDHWALRGYSKQPRRAASPLGRLVEEEERWKAPDPQGVLTQNWGGIEQNRSITCMMLKAKANDRRKNLALCRDEFRGP